MWVDGRTSRGNKAAFSIFSGVAADAVLASRSIYNWNKKNVNVNVLKENSNK